MIALRIVAAIVSALLLAGMGEAALSGKPLLRVAATAPLAVSGSGFRPAERVRVTAITVHGSLGKTVRVTGRGRFLVRFASLTADPCVVRAVRAVGAKGSRALLRFPIAACQPPGNPKVARTRPGRPIPGSWQSSSPALLAKDVTNQSRHRTSIRAAAGFEQEAVEKVVGRPAFIVRRVVRRLNLGSYLQTP